MKIAILAPHRILGGGETSLRALMRAMPEHQWAVFYCAEHPGEVCDYSGIAHVTRVERVGNIVRQVTDFGAKIVLFYGDATVEAMKLARLEAPPKLVFLAKTSDRAGTFRWWMMARERVDAAVAVSAQIGLEMMREGKQLWQPGLDKVFVIPQGVDRKAFSPDGPPRSGPLASVGYVGRLASGKGIEYLPSGLAGLRLELLIAGPAGRHITQGAFAAECARHRVRVRFMPPEQYPVEAYRRIDLLCLLSAREGAPNAVMEAAAMGVPAVATRVGTLPDYWRDGENIFFVDRPRDLRPLMLKLIRSPERVRAAGRAAAEVARRFDIALVAQKYARLFAALVEGRRLEPLGYVLGRAGGEGDVLCAEPLLRELKRLGTPYLLHTEAHVGELLERDFMASRADRPRPLLYGAPGRHISEQYADQLGVVVRDAPRIDLPATVRRNGKMRVALHAWVKKACKQWPMTHWEELTEGLNALGVETVQVDPGPCIQQVWGREPGAIGPMREYAEALRSCDLLVTVEGFPHHLAHALGVPAIVLWPGSVEETISAYPDQVIVRSDLACRCTGATWGDTLLPTCAASAGLAPGCMLMISPRRVLDAARAWLAARAAGGHP